MVMEALGAAGLTAAGLTAYGVRSRSARLFGPSVWRGPSTSRAIALTFDDGPSESTPDLLTLLYLHNAGATFFQCGHHVRRLPDIARHCLAEGHEIGNHTDTHPALYLRSGQFIFEQFERAQTAITEATGVAPRLLRAPYGCRWFGFSAMQKRLDLLGVMWTSIACDWRLPPQAVADHLEPRVRAGSIVCFHDGRELTHHPDIAPTLEALKILLPKWTAEGYRFLTVSQLLALDSPARA